jgi:CRP-like cAMP-binding protein
MESAAKINELIERVELFHGLSQDDVVKIFSKGMTMRVAKGEAIFYKGTIGNQMYVVLAGSIGVHDNKKVIATLRTGDMFGEMALVNKEPRSATVLALEDSRLFVLSESTFEKLLTKRVAVQMLLNIVRTLSRRLKDSNTRNTAPN